MQEILEKYIPKTKWLIHKLDFYKKWVTINVGWESHKWSIAIQPPKKMNND